MPLWRPFVFITICSCCSSPSGHVPGGTAVDRVLKIFQDLGEAGAGGRPGLDRVFHFASRVFSAISKDLIVISFYLEVLLVTCTASMISK
jgi:hypothetical protein